MRLLPLLAAPACIVATVPTQSPMGIYAPVAEPGETSGELFADLAMWPAAGGRLQLPVGDATAELGGHAALTSVAFTPAIWLHAPDRIAHRLGLAVGAGDLLGVYPFRMPYAGGSYHLQIAREHPNHLSTTTLGFSFVSPVGDTSGLATDVQAIIITSPAAWFNARWGWAWPVGRDGDRFAVAVGFDVGAGRIGDGIVSVPFVPAPALGFDLQLR